MEKHQRERKIILEEGKFYGPKITDEITNKDYFIDCYKKAAKQALSIIKSNNKEHNNIKNRIAFLGNRGQGKTSMMYSFIKSLRTKNKVLFSNQLDNVEILILDVIDPSMFEDCSNVLDILLGQMFDKITNEDIINQNKIEKEDISDMTIMFNDLYNQIRIIKDKNILNENMNLYEGAIDTLLAIKNITNFRENLKNFIDKFLKLTTRKSEKSILVIPIDDIDIDLTHCYETVETVRKYLNIPNVLIIMAAKLEQLHECIRLENLNKVLKSTNEDSNRVYEDVYNMTTKYLLKLLPENRRIHIPEIVNNINSLQYKTQIEIKSKSITTTNTNIQSDLCKMLYEKTDILILDNNQHHNYLISGNLRDVVDLYSCLYEMDQTDNSDKIEKTRIYLSNLEKFKDYFLNNWCTNNLHFNTARLIRKLYNNGGCYKNHLLIEMIAELSPNDENAQGNLSKLLKQRGKRELFYDLSDISYHLNKISNHNYRINVDNASKFVFAVKICYTIIMNQLKFIDELNKLDNDSEKGKKTKEDNQAGYLIKFIGGRILKENVLLRVKEDYTSKKTHINGNVIANCVDANFTSIFKKNRDNENLSLLAILSTTSKDNARDIYFYNPENKSVENFYFDPCQFFFNGLDLNYFTRYNENEKMKNKIDGQLNIKFDQIKNSLELVSKTIICNMALYDFYIDWLDIRYYVKKTDLSLKISTFYESTKEWLNQLKIDLSRQDDAFKDCEFYKALEEIITFLKEAITQLKNSGCDLINKKAIEDEEKKDKAINEEKHEYEDDNRGKK